MSKNTNIIEINGRRYDATSGIILDANLPSTRNRIVDGIIPSKTAPTRSVAKSVKGHAPQSAKTLMRYAVHKPAHSSGKSQLVAQPHLASRPASVDDKSVIPKLSVMQINPRLLSQAQQLPKSDHVHHFHKAPFSPLALSQAASSPVPSAISAKVNRDALNITAAPQPLTHKSSKPSLDIFERALAQANSHEQPLVKPLKDSPRSHFKRRLMLIAASSLALIVIGGFFVYQNIPHLNLYLASNKAGFQASLPSYRPAGFSLSTLNSSPGNVAINFLSNSDQRSFKLTEQTSDWDSATLRDTFVAPTAKQSYETIQASGRTIYVYGNHNATWVNGGIWYQLQSQGALSTKQLIQIASST